jgi:hypothetical protein
MLLAALLEFTPLLLCALNILVETFSFCEELIATASSTMAALFTFEFCPGINP